MPRESLKDMGRYAVESSLHGHWSIKATYIAATLEAVALVAVNELPLLNSLRSLEETANLILPTFIPCTVALGLAHAIATHAEYIRSKRQQNLPPQ